jgi:hypothetical protein
VHLEFLAQANLRVSVFLQWVWTYITGKRGSRLIVIPYQPEPHAPPTGAAANPISAAHVEQRATLKNLSGPRSNEPVPALDHR